MMERLTRRCTRLLLFMVALVSSFSVMYAQSGIVSGIVKDNAGEPIIGASVVVKGTTKGTMTGLDGKFTLDAPEGSTIVVSFLGYKTQEITVGSRKTFNIVLKDDTELLDEVVVIGYGSVKKDDATGSVIAIKAEEKNKGLTVNAQDMIAGKIAGVSVVSGGGAPGAAATIRIRGGSSLSAVNDPLIVIDGVIMSNETVAGMSNGLSSLNPNDIETFTVLKDASATAIYGSRASNGVILITTKKGVAGKPRFTYDGNMSISHRRNKVDVLSASELRDYITDNFSTNATMMDALNEYPDTNTDWQDEVFRTSFGTEHNFSAFGALSKTLPYRISVGYTNQDGIIKTSNFQRYTGSVSLTPSLFDDHLRLNINAKGTHIKNRFADTGAVGGAVGFDPTKPVRNDSQYGGFYAWTTGGKDGPLVGSAARNPVSLLEMKRDLSKVNSFIGNIQFDYKFHFLPELRANVNLGIDYSKSDGDNSTNPWAQSNFSSDEKKSGNQEFYKQTDQNKIFEAYLQYAKELPSIKSKIDVMGGHSYQNFKKEGTNDYYFVDRSTASFGELIVKTDSPHKDWGSEYVLTSFFGRINYTLMEKYLFTYTMRADASSRFHKDHRWGTFPALAFAWKMKEESFLKSASALSELKLRLGWGITGQQDLGADYYYPYMSFFKEGKGGAKFPIYDASGNVTWVNVLAPTASNPNLKWEQTTTYNTGIDFGFLNNRINGAVDVYFRKTKDLLNREVNVVAGTNFAEYVPSNIGSLENKGIEFTLNAKPIVTRDFTWDAGFNIAHNKGKITKLTIGDNDLSVGKRFGSTGGDGAKEIQIHSENYAPGMFYVYKQIYDSDGNPIEGAYVDRDGNGVIDDKDLYHYKKPAADVLMGFNSKFYYRNFDFGFNLRVSLGNYVYNAQAANAANLSADGLFSNNNLRNIQRSAFDTNFQSRQRQSDYYVQNASFMRVDNITLGYTFENLFYGKGGLRIYGTVQNPFVFTKYKGLDPELNQGTDAGIDNNVYPRPVIGIFGVNLNF